MDKANYILLEFSEIPENAYFRYQSNFYVRSPKDRSWGRSQNEQYYKRIPQKAIVAMTLKDFQNFFAT
jgi:hypothetical protein